MTTDQLVGLFSNTPGFADGTRRTYASIMKNTMTRLSETGLSDDQLAGLGSLPKKTVVPALFAWADKLRAHSPAYQAKSYAVMRAFFRFCVRMDLREGNPMDMLDPPTIHPELQKAPAWDAETTTRFLAAITTLRDLVIMRLFLTSGFRSSDLRNARVSDLLEDGRRLLVVGKGRKPARVPIEDSTRELLIRYMAESAPTTWLFPSMTSKQARCGNGHMGELVRRYCKKAGIPPTGPHTLRRTCATLLNEGGAAPGQIRLLLRHSNQQMTDRYIKTKDATVTLSI